MQKDEILLTLRSFMSMTKMQCDMEGKDFDVEAAVSAAMPVVDSLLYTLSTGGKLEGEGGAPAKPETLECFAQDMLDAVRDAMDNQGIGHHWDDVSAELDGFVDGYLETANTSMDADPAGSTTVPARTSDDVFNKLFGAKP